MLPIQHFGPVLKVSFRGRVSPTKTRVYLCIKEVLGGAMAGMFIQGGKGRRCCGARSLLLAPWFSFPVLFLWLEHPRPQVSESLRSPIGNGSLAPARAEHSHAIVSHRHVQANRLRTDATLSELVCLSKIQPLTLSLAKCDGKTFYCIPRAYGALHEIAFGYYAAESGYQQLLTLFFTGYEALVLTGYETGRFGAICIWLLLEPTMLCFSDVL